MGISGSLARCFYIDVIVGLWILDNAAIELEAGDFMQFFSYEEYRYIAWKLWMNDNNVKVVIQLAQVNK